MIYFIGASAIWTFLERLATDKQFEPTATGMMLGITLFFAVIGAALTGVTGDRFGNFPPYIVYSIMLVVGVLLLCGAGNFILFSVGACAFMLAWSASDGYQYAIVADVDPDGRHIVLAVPAMGVGSMIGTHTCRLSLFGRHNRVVVHHGTGDCFNSGSAGMGKQRV